MNYPNFFSVYRDYKLYAEQHGSCYFKIQGIKNRVFFSVKDAQDFIDDLLNRVNVADTDFIDIEKELAEWERDNKDLIKLWRSEYDVKPGFKVITFDYVDKDGKKKYRKFEIPLT